MEDKREEKTVLCVFGEKEACSLPGIKCSRREKEPDEDYYFDVLVETTTLCPSLTLAGFSGKRLKKSISECKNVI